MRDAFAGFCDALFNEELRDATVDRLRRAGVLKPGEQPPSGRERRVALIRKGDAACFLDLIYRFQFISDDRDYQIVSSYVNNAPLLNQFVHEFLQNAEDAGAERCRFVFEDDRVIVANDGRAFTHENLYAICSFRESDKASQQRGLQIGKFGVGFKSVFRVSRSPLVVTWDESVSEPLAFRFFIPGEFDGEYHRRLASESPFRFSPRVPECERDDFPSRIGYLFPVPVPFADDLRAIWVEHRSGTSRGSMFILPLRPDLTPGQRAKIFDRVEPEAFYFLKMQALDVLDLRGGLRKSRGWSKRVFPLNRGGEIEVLDVEEHQEDASTQSLGKALRLEVGPIAVPRDDLGTLDQLVREVLPDEVRVRIVAALDGDDLNDPGVDGARLKGGLFNGLPVPGVATGLNSYIDAPFNLSADRTNILDDAFNEWLIGRIGDSACHFLCLLRQDEDFRNQCFRQVPADLEYGRRKGIGELTQRFARIHDRLREEAIRIGVLPALDDGEPLRPREGLALREADANKREVYTAIESLIGGQPISIFAKINIKNPVETMRLCRLPERSYEESIAKALDHAAFFSYRWMKVALADPGWQVCATSRDPRWYADLFAYFKGGVLSENLDDFLDIAWVPAFSAEDAPIPPKQVTLIEGATGEDLAVVRDGLRAVGGTAEPWRLACSDFTNEYVESCKAGEKPTPGIRRLSRLFAGRSASWEQVIERLISLLSAMSPDSDPTPIVKTPGPVLDLIGLADRKGGLSTDAAARLARLIRVVVKFDGQDGTSLTAWPVIDLLLRPAAELLPVPLQVYKHLPQLSIDADGGKLDVITRLSPAVPTPELVRTVLDHTEAAAGETVAWALKLAALWETTRKPFEIRAALGSMRVPGRHSAEFLPLWSYSRDGFGKKWIDQEKGLAQLFGPKTPELGVYSSVLGDAGLKRLRDLMDEVQFLPTAGDLKAAMARLIEIRDDSRRIALATDLAEFLGGVWDHYPSSGRRRGEPPELSRLLREESWVPATTRDGKARPGELLLEDRELLELLGDAVAAPLLPDAADAGDRWIRSLRVLTDKAELKFLDVGALGHKAGLALAAGLRRRLAGQDVNKKLELIGRFLDRPWFAPEADVLRNMIDLGSIHSNGSSTNDLLWIVVESPEQKLKLETEFRRGVVVVYHPRPAGRRALVWASGGMTSPQGDPLDSSTFALRYVRALGTTVEVLDPRERAHVILAYRALARDLPAGPWFDRGDHAILTESGSLAPVGMAIYAGGDAEICQLLSKHQPGCCLAAAIRDLRPSTREAVLTGLRLDALPRRDAWIRLSLVPRGKDRVLDDWPADRSHLDQAVRAVIAGTPKELDATNLTIRLVDAIDRRIELPSAGTGLVFVEPANFYLQERPRLLFVTDEGKAAIDDELLRLGDRAKYDRNQQRLMAFRVDWTRAKGQVEYLADDQKQCLLSNYRIAHYDPSFRESDRELDRNQKSLEERWASFLADRSRITRVVKKHTTDIGYGQETVARELLQNIDDAYHDLSHSPREKVNWVEFRLLDRALVVSHAGGPFTAADLERICGLGGSGKSERVQIGRFGLGFKSVLGVTDRPIVLSHPYSFAIEHVVVPTWLDPEGEECRKWQHSWQSDQAVTRFVLEARPGQKAVDELVQRLVKLDDLSPRNLLFLNNLRKITLKAGQVERSVERTDLDAPKGLFANLDRPSVFDGDIKLGLRRLELKEDGRAPTAEEFLVVEGQARINVPTEEGPQIKLLRCGIALPWDSDNVRLGLPMGGDSRLHLFLPTKTRTGLPFLVNGEFLTNLGRTDIDGDHQANSGLASAIAALVRSTLKAAFAGWKDDPAALRAVTRMAPWPGDSSQEAAWLRPIRGAFAALIKANEPVILTADGSLVRPKECILGQRFVRVARGPVLAADPSCLLDPLVDTQIEAEVSRAAGGDIRTLTGPEMIKTLFPPGLLRVKAARRVGAILRVLYEQKGDDLTQRTESYHAISELSSLPCMPDDRGGVSCPTQLDPPDRPTENAGTGRRADLTFVMGSDRKLLDWVVTNLHWACPPRGQRWRVIHHKTRLRSSSRLRVATRSGVITSGTLPPGGKGWDRRAGRVSRALTA